MNYKVVPSIQIQAICDARDRFLNEFVGYPGFGHDARVLRNDPIFYKALYPPAGTFFGDDAYPCLKTQLAF